MTTINYEFINSLCAPASSPPSKGVNPEPAAPALDTTFGNTRPELASPRQTLTPQQGLTVREREMDRAAAIGDNLRIEGRNLLCHAGVAAASVGAALGSLAIYGIVDQAVKIGHLAVDPALFLSIGLWSGGALAVAAAGHFSLNALQTGFHMGRDLLFGERLGGYDRVRAEMLDVSPAKRVRAISSILSQTRSLQQTIIAASAAFELAVSEADPAQRCAIFHAIIPFLTPDTKGYRLTEALHRSYIESLRTLSNDSAATFDETFRAEISERLADKNSWSPDPSAVDAALRRMQQRLSD